MRALTALKQVGMASQKTDGRPPEMPLEKIMRDPDNPRPPLHLRTPEEQQKQSELNVNIKRRGVKSPVSLRPHPTIPDMWVINHGHCRYDAAETAGFATIPYFIDPNFDSYDQVAENLHRSDLSIWAIAAFIERKLAEGQTKLQIAERLGKEGHNYVTEHLALVDAPGCIHQAYANGIRSPRTLYDLRRAYDEFPEQVDAWCSSGARITRDAIKELLNRLRHDVIEGTAPDSVLSSHQQNRHHPSEASGDGTRGHDGHRTASRIARIEEELRHDVETTPGTAVPAQAPKLRHDVELVSETARSLTGSPPLGATGTVEQVLVRYKGNAARIASGTTVKIVLDGSDDFLEVQLSDLVFEGTR